MFLSAYLKTKPPSNTHTALHHHSPGNGSNAGDDQDEGAIDKRRRNCLASARFRQKKKAEMQMLEEIAAAKTEECEKLQQSVKLLQVCVCCLCVCLSFCLFACLAVSVRVLVWVCVCVSV